MRSARESGWPPSMSESRAAFFEPCVFEEPRNDWNGIVSRSRNLRRVDFTARGARRERRGRARGGRRSTRRPCMLPTIARDVVRSYHGDT